VLKGPDVQNYEPARPVPGAAPMPLPEDVRKLLGWTEAAAKATVGAHPVRP
jgi:hypothetical protein